MQTDKHPSIIGEELRRLRSLKGIKQQVVAGKLGISRQAYSKTERSDRISMQKAVQVLTAMDCSLNDLENLRILIPLEN